MAVDGGGLVRGYLLVARFGASGFRLGWGFGLVTGFGGRGMEIGSGTCLRPFRTRLYWAFFPGTLSLANFRGRVATGGNPGL